MNDAPVAVVGLGLQCQTCGVPTDTVQLRGLDGLTAWIVNQPCGHRVLVDVPAEARS